jgi:hypothetical protein
MNQRRKNQMKKLKVDDHVALSVQGKRAYAHSNVNPHNMSGKIIKVSSEGRSVGRTVRVKWYNGQVNSYFPYELEASLLQPQVIEVWAKNLTIQQKKNLLRMLEEDVNTEEVVLFSVAGKKWGKKRYPESKLKMTYTIFKGQIKGQPVITKL